MTHFFDLPRELRDQIYAQYVIIDGGYVLDFNSNTLKAANREPIDLAFMLTCKTIAKELRPIPFSVNTLNFSTVYSEEHRKTAGLFGYLLGDIHISLGEKLDNIFPDTLGVPDDIWEALSQSHPTFAPCLETIKRRRNKWDIEESARMGRLRPQRVYRNVGHVGSCGETPSAFRTFSRSVFRAILAHRNRFDSDQLANFENDLSVVGGFSRKDGRPTNLDSLVNVNPDPWEIPTPERLEELLSHMRREQAERLLKRWDRTVQGFSFLNPSQIKYHYSAAAAAIRFLNSLSKDSRLSIRNILLKEERIAVGFTECHGLGLIPYCQENARLRVERRVSMWRAVLPTTMTRLNSYGYKEGIRSDAQLLRTQATRQVAIWVMEALELERAGMPSGSFTLTLDGDSSCSEIFHDLVKRDAAWQEAIDLCLQRGTLPPLRWDVRRTDSRDMNRFMDPLEDPTEVFNVSDNCWYVCEGFPQAVNAIMAGTSLVKCNFGLGAPWDVERLIEENKGWSMLQWRTGWHAQQTRKKFEPDPLSPSWMQLSCDDTWETKWPFRGRS